MKNYKKHLETLNFHNEWLDESIVNKKHISI